MNLAKTKENLREAKATVSYWKTMVHEKETEDEDNGAHRFNDKDIIYEDKRLKPNDLTVEQRNQCMKDMKSMLRVFLNAPSSNYRSKNNLYHKVVQLEDEYHLESLSRTIDYCVDFDSFPSTETCMWLSYSPCIDTDMNIMDLIKKWDGEDYTNY